MGQKLVLIVMGAVALLAGRATSTQQKAHFDKEKCCEPATRQPPPAQNCETDCIAGGVFCDPAPVIGNWKNGSCKADPIKSCGKTVTNRPMPVYECTAIPCTTLHGQPGQKCVWSFLGDTGPVQPAVNSCIGTRC